MTICINLLRIDDIAAMPGIRMASATAVLQYKGESLGRYIRER